MIVLRLLDDAPWAWLKSHRKSLHRDFIGKIEEWVPMPNLSDSCLIDHVPLSVRQVANGVGMQFPLSLRKFLREAACPHAGCVILHLKFLAAAGIPLSTMLIEMRTVYNNADIGVRIGSRQDLFGPTFDPFVSLDVGDCNSLTAEQTQLYANRDNVGVRELAIYFVRDTVNSFAGCAQHPSNQGGAVVASSATRYTLAHEVGHILGLNHVDDPPPPDPAAPPAQLDRLMTGRGTFKIENPPPDISSGEVVTMNSSIFTTNC
ncbi:reprolysin-like metallopeptidase [Streptomyces sp. NPDC002920]